MEWREGGCHCGRVRFKVKSDLAQVLECNCSICAKKGYLHLIVKAEDFLLLQGAEDQTCYRFNTETAKHYFCSHCGVSSYYIPRSHPDGVDVNARCLDDLVLSDLKIAPFNGREWEANIQEIEGYEA